MRLVIALGGNALLRRGEPMTPDVQRANVRAAAQALAPLVGAHELVISHGNGPQVGLLALQAASRPEGPHWPLDVLGAQTEGMIGYLIEQELGNLVDPEVPFATILTQVEVDPLDPAFAEPTKQIGPHYADEEEARRIAAEHGWAMKREGEGWRRVVPSPRPRRLFEVRPVRWLLERGCVVICAGGGGIPTLYGADGRLGGVEAVVDKDLASAVLARDLDADLLVLATDADGVYLDYGTPRQRRIVRSSPERLAEFDFAAGSMAPKIEAAREFVGATGRRVSIGALERIEALVAGTAGTCIEPGAALEVDE